MFQCFDVACASLPRSCGWLHLNFIPGNHRPPLSDGQPPLSADETAFLVAASEWVAAEGGYGHLQAAKPQTVAYALTDTPVGLAGWIVEKIRAWSDCGGSVERAFSLDALITNISIYWFTSTIGSSMRFHRVHLLRPMQFAPGERVLPPFGGSCVSARPDAASRLGGASL